MAGRRVIVTLGDVTLFEDDLELLRGQSWLNDELIAFQYEWLMSRVQSTALASKVSHASVGAFAGLIKLGCSEGSVHASLFCMPTEPRDGNSRTCRPT